MNEIYDKQQNEIMDVLEISENERSFGKILNVIKDLKGTNNTKRQLSYEETETSHYFKAQKAYESYAQNLFKNYGHNI